VTSVGNALRNSDPAAAVSAYVWAVELNPQSPFAHGGLAAGYEAAGRKEQAIAEAKKTLDLLGKDTTLSANWKAMVRDAATALIERLERK
jgi:Flp pilus assembly protein TadD